MFHIHLLSPGHDEATVITKIVKLTDQSSKEATRIVQESGIIQRNLEHQEAQRFKGELESVGAQIMLIPAGKFNLPPGKPLFVQLQDNQDQPVAGAQLSLKTRDERFDQALNPAVSNDTGRVFFLDFSDLVSEFFKELPPVWFEVTRDNVTLPTTHQAFDWENFINFPDTIFLVQVQADEPVVPEPPADTTTPYEVAGTVQLATEAPAAGFTVRAFDRDLRSEQLLGETVTDGKGKYSINYTSQQFKRVDKEQADLVVKVVDALGQVIYTPTLEQITFNAPPQATVDITLPPIPATGNEFEMMLQTLVPLLEDVAIAELQETEEHQDITFLSRETNYPSEKLEHLVVTHRLADHSDIRPDFFYVLLRQGTLLKSDLTQLLNMRYAVTLATETEPLFFDVVRLDAEAIRAAVDRSVERNEVSESIREDLDTIVKQLASSKDKADSYYRNEHPRRVFGRLERLLTPRNLEMLREISDDQNNTSDPTSLFTRLEEALQGTEEDSAHTDLKLAELLGFDEHIITEVREVLELTEPEQVPEIAALSPSDWRNVLRDAADRIEVGGQPLNPELIDQHASLLAHKLEQRYPTVAFRAQLKRHDDIALNQREAIVSFMEEHRSFDLKSTNIEAFFRQELPATNGEAEPLKAELKGVQRLFKLAPTYQKTQALWQTNVRSARDISLKGETAFTEALIQTEEFTLEEARQVYQQAATVYTATTLLAADIQANASALIIPALANPPENVRVEEEVAPDYPNLKTLFKTIDLCECQHCRSVYSPAAYLVDVMQFLRGRTVLDTTVADRPARQGALEVLLKRRDDLTYLDLSCENTNTPLPYIDIVCELLERVVAPLEEYTFDGTVAEGTVNSELLNFLQEKGEPVTEDAVVESVDSDFILRDKKAVFLVKVFNTGGWNLQRLPQTHRSAAELAAAPAFVNAAAYQKLEESRIAFQLPFSLPHQEAQAYLAQYGVARATLMRTLGNGSQPRFHTAAEQLGLSEVERQLIVIADPGNQASYWNVTSGSVADELKTVDTFLTRTQLSYQQLSDLLALSFIRGERSLSIQHERLDSCDTTTKTITNLDDEVLDRIHRFLRLWQRAGWDMAVLDRAIVYPRLGQGLLDDNCLTQLADLLLLRDQLGLPLAELVIFYGPIPSAGDQSRYAQLFLNESALGKVDDRLQPASVLANETDDPANQVKLSEIANTLALVLGTSPQALSLLIDRLDPDAVLSRDHLSRLYGHHQLLQTLDLTPADYLAVLDLTGTDALASPDKTLNVVRRARAIINTGVRPVALHYLLHHEAVDLDDRTLSEAQITDFLGELQQQYQEAYIATKSPYAPEQTADENQAFVRPLLEQLPNREVADINAFLEMVQGSWQDSTTRTAPQIIDALLSEVLDVTPLKTAQAAVAVAAEADLEEKRAQFIQLFLEQLSAHFFEQDKSKLLRLAVVALFGLDEAEVSALLSFARLKESGDERLHTLLTVSQFVDVLAPPHTLPNITPVAFPAQYEAVRLLHTIAGFLMSMPVASDHLAWLLQHTESLGWLALDRLPYTAAQPNQPLDEWEKLADGLALLAQYPPVNDLNNPEVRYSLSELVVQATAGTINENDLLVQLSRLTGWPSDLLVELHRHFNLSVSDYSQPATFRRLEAAVVLLHSLGMTVDEAVSLTAPQLTANVVQQLRQSLKARYQEEQWLDILKQVQDRLRPQKRNALVAYLVANNDRFNSANDLYDYYLIDTQMGACRPTSRIVLAHSTLQLFVQRCLMGLEAKAVADTETDRGWKQWQWMRNYRVWEANRKVFLYPENWIEPELRPEQSYLFEELESELLQNELTDRAVENATVKYLEKLDQIAFLEVVASYYQVGTYTMHVFGRTKGGEPHLYFYRRFIEERYWTPWEKVELDIQGNHLLAFMRNDRLYLAWPMFLEEPDQDQEIKVPTPSEVDAGVTTQKTKRRWKIQLAISEYAGDRWLPQKISQDALVTNYSEDNLPAKGNFQLSYLSFSDLFSSFATLSSSNFLNITVITCTYIAGNTQSVLGQYNLSGCKGYPEVNRENHININWSSAFPDTIFRDGRYVEDNIAPEDDLEVKLPLFGNRTTTPLNRTPGKYIITRPFQLSEVDLYEIFMAIAPLLTGTLYSPDRKQTPSLLSGAYVPFFLENGSQNYVVVPTRYRYIIKPELDLILIEDTDTRITFSNIHTLFSRFILLLREYLPLFVQDPNQALNQLANDSSAQTLSQQLTDLANTTPRLRFANMYHPLVCSIQSILYRDGIPGLMRRSVQQQRTSLEFSSAYMPNSRDNVSLPYPIEDVDFTPEGSYSSYNWELFFHLPFTIANKLMNDQRFEAAQNWLHYVFNPTGALEGNGAQKYWVTKPFYELSPDEYVEQRIDELLRQINSDPSGQTISDLKFAVEQWRKHPFDPHRIARTRTVAYQKAVLIKYLENLLRWGDFLFRQATTESINEATQLYVLADKLLGTKPRTIPPAAAPRPKNYQQLTDEGIDLFSNATVELENLLPELPINSVSDEVMPPEPAFGHYFCLPQNDKLLAYWDQIDDRLTKIRNCQDIEGKALIPALFAPPIDPGALVKAAAAGLSISDIVAGLNAPLPHYRFSVMSQKASELAQEVRGFGNTLLQTLEKKDGEALSLLRSSLEIKLLEKVRAVKEQQVVEAGEQIVSLERSRAVVEERQQYYKGLVYESASEELYSEKLGNANDAQQEAQWYQRLASVLSLIPDITAGIAGFGGSPHAVVSAGGSGLAKAASFMAEWHSDTASEHNFAANQASIKAGRERRWEEWGLQKKLAAKELEQIDQQIVAAQIRVDITKKEVENHDLQIENARATDEYMRDKFTNQQLYDWMLGQLSGLYFQSYQLAYDVAKKAERTFRHELALEDSDHIGFGYWDGLKKGLLAGDRLLQDIKRMEVAYLDKNKREYELTKHISLRQLSPLALLKLKATGVCDVQIPEWLFDLDCPGHYMRRIKTVAVSIPAIAGPYTNVNCTLSLQKSTVRKSALLKDEKYERKDEDDRFTDYYGTIQSIVTSSAQSDSGMFEVNLRDERFLPFENAGAESRWRIELPQELRQFDYNSISDVIIHMRYTARQGGSQLASKATGYIKEFIKDASQQGLRQLFNLKHDFPNEWHTFATSEEDSFTIPITRNHFPYLAQTGSIELADSPIRLYRVDSSGSGLEEISLNGNGDANLTDTLGELNGENRAGEITIQGELEASSEWFLLIDYTLED